jgi:nucleoredoxin
MGQSFAADKATKFSSNINKMLVNKKGKKVTDSKITKAKYIAVYYSASWCPPCRKFTPILSKFYTSTAKAKGVEMVLNGLDRTEKKQNAYLGHMEFPGIKFSKRKDADLQKYCGRGIPCLTVFDASGKVVIDGRKTNAYQALEQLKKLIK